MLLWNTANLNCGFAFNDTLLMYSTVRDDRTYTLRLSNFETKLIIHNFTSEDIGIYRCNGGPLTTTFTIVLAGQFISDFHWTVCVFTHDSLCVALIWEYVYSNAMFVYKCEQGMSMIVQSFKWKHNHGVDIICQFLHVNNLKLISKL